VPRYVFFPFFFLSLLTIKIDTYRRTMAREGPNDGLYRRWGLLRLHGAYYDYDGCTGPTTTVRALQLLSSGCTGHHVSPHIAHNGKRMTQRRINRRWVLRLGVTNHHTQGIQRRLLKPPTVVQWQEKDRRWVLQLGAYDSQSPTTTHKAPNDDCSSHRLSYNGKRRTQQQFIRRCVLRLGAYDSQSPTTTHKAPNDGLYRRWGLRRLLKPPTVAQWQEKDRRWVLQLGAYDSQSPTTTHKAPNDGLYRRWGLGKPVTPGSHCLSTC
jgi:hypothetical protein